MTDRAAYVAGLRELADRLDRNPDCPLPYVGTDTPLDWILNTREDVAAVARLMGNASKERDAKGSLKLSGHLHGLSLSVLTFGEVCERVEIGVQEIEVTEVVTPAVTRTVTESVPVYEYRCPESILADRATALAADEDDADRWPKSPRQERDPVGRMGISENLRCSGDAL